MRRSTRGYVIWLLLAAGLLVPTKAVAGLILETATLGPPPIRSIGIGATQWLGARFTLTEETRIETIGVNLSGGNSIFGAIVPLSGPSGLPPLNPTQIESYALAATTITLPLTPEFIDVSIPLPVTLGPGSYGVLFGVGEFGSSGLANLSRNNIATSQASFFAAVPGTTSFQRWIDMPDLNATPLRIFVTGTATIPEPSSMILAGLGILTLAGIGPRLHRRSRRTR